MKLESVWSNEVSNFDSRAIREEKERKKKEYDRQTMMEQNLLIETEDDPYKTMAKKDRSDLDS